MSQGFTKQPTENPVIEQAFGDTGTVAIGSGTSRWYTKTTKTIVSVHAAVNIASTSGVVTIDVHKDGTTIFTTQADRPEIVASAYSSDLKTPAVTTFAIDSYLTVDVDAAGTGASDLVVIVRYREA